MTIRTASDRSLLVSFGDEISLENHVRVDRLTRSLEGVRGILNRHPAFSSVLVDFDPRLYTHGDVESLIRERFAAARSEQPAEARTLEVPVRFGGENGPDLEDVSRHTGLAPAAVIERYCAANYLVFFVGFSTCFPYLGGLPSELATPRLAAPRKHVPEGSVAIGGSQAGVYPLASPGGWRLIGRTPLLLFDPQGTPPGMLRMSDCVRFVPVE